MKNKLFYKQQLAFSILIIAISIISTQSKAQSPRNLVLVTIDGLRWQEVFNGADSSLLFNNKYISQDSDHVIKSYWAAHPDRRREQLMPFTWKTLGSKGQLYGNRNYANQMQVKNNYWFSYPGYSEILSGFVDEKINSNEHPANENDHILAFLNRQPAYRNKVAAFANWSAFGRIINAGRHNIFLSYGNFPLPDSLIKKNKTLKVLNDLHPLMPSLWETDRLDGLTYAIAKEYMIAYKPKILYLALGEMDEWAHSGKYDFYLDAVNKADYILNDLWSTLQAMPFYRNNTYLIITTDHGRGNGAEWTSHNNKINGSNETWMAVMGPGITATGEIKASGSYNQSQIAQTISWLLGFTYKPGPAAGERILLH